KDTLNGIARCFASRAASPGSYRTVEPLALKPSRISSGDMHGEFKTACSRLAKLIASTEQALTVGCTCVMEVDLLWIWLVLCKLVRNDPTLLLGQQPLG